MFVFSGGAEPRERVRKLFEISMSVSKNFNAIFFEQYSKRWRILRGELFAVTSKDGRILNVIPAEVEKAQRRVVRVPYSVD